MKLKITSAALLLSLALSASAADKVCVSKAENSLSRYTLEITDLADITKTVSYGNRYDSVTKVLVNFKHASGNKVLFNQSFEAIALSFDVDYKINSANENGFKFWTYSNEADQSGVEFIDANGAKTRISMTCHW